MSVQTRFFATSPTIVDTGLPSATICRLGVDLPAAAAITVTTRPMVAAVAEMAATTSARQVGKNTGNPALVDLRVAVVENEVVIVAATVAKGNQGSIAKAVVTGGALPHPTMPRMAAAATVVMASAKALPGVDLLGIRPVAAVVVSLFLASPEGGNLSAAVVASLGIGATDLVIIQAAVVEVAEADAVEEAEVPACRHPGRLMTIGTAVAVAEEEEGMTVAAGNVGQKTQQDFRTIVISGSVARGSCFDTKASARCPSLPSLALGLQSLATKAETTL